VRIIIETIPHAQQTYETCGNWQIEGDEIHVQVSDLGDWRMEALIGIHEACEAALCLHAGISQRAVDRFDMRYEEQRPPGDESEPGDAIEAPYGLQHCYATAVERLLCAAMGIQWGAYEQRVQELPPVNKTAP
jgi:hypothetical protein